ncbi:hypothetical protein ACELLULO517_03745 [Acidisoma cellulosilytica]|uniref:Uncharacterized protein n=1 Tax=Acidisoma cellulosilyticum TaxID=2802395 RepID=A0A963YY58_9PROT|nr:hypothetical protein [Acidisoma cellulosilyticum]MCB8879334.1 hypothetical protein [Acidisoma cellulosilyticum]
MSGDSDFNVPGLMDAGKRPESSLARKSLVGVFLFVIGGLVVTAILTGETPPPVGMAAYFINGQTISVGRHTLDLAKPIFVRGAAAICPTESDLENYSAGSPGDCTMVTNGLPAGLVGIQADGMREPSIQMQMQTPNGPVKGWVDYNNLHN